MSEDLSRPPIELSKRQEDKLNLILNSINILDVSEGHGTILLTNPEMFESKVRLLREEHQRRMGKVIAKIPKPIDDFAKINVFGREYEIGHELRSKLRVPEELRKKFFFHIKDKGPRNAGQPIAAGYSYITIPSYRRLSWIELFVKDDFTSYEHIMISK